MTYVHVPLDERAEYIYNLFNRPSKQWHDFTVDEIKSPDTGYV